MNKIIIPLIALMLSLFTISTFGITGLFSIILGHCFLMWNKDSHELLIKSGKYVVYLALLLSYGYYLGIVFLVFFGKN